MHHLQPQDLFKALEIVVAMQQLVLRQQTKSSDKAVDRLMNRVPAPPQFTIVFGGSNGHFATARVENIEP